jgi:hypothetical protein
LTHWTAAHLSGGPPAHLYFQTPLVADTFENDYILDIIYLFRFWKYNKTQFLEYVVYFLIFAVYSNSTFLRSLCDLQSFEILKNSNVNSYNNLKLFDISLKISDI